MSVFNTFQSMYLPTLLRWIWTTVSSAVVCIIDHSPIFFLSLINTGSLIRTTANRESRKEKMIYHSPQYLFTNRPQDETRLVGQIHQNYTQYPEVASITSPKSTLRIITKAFQEKQVISTQLLIHLTDGPKQSKVMQNRHVPKLKAQKPPTHYALTNHLRKPGHRAPRLSMPRRTCHTTSAIPSMIPLKKN